MTGRSYTSRPRQPRKARTWPFELDGVQFTCTLRDDADAVMEWSEMATTALSSEGNQELESAAGVAFTSRFFKLMMTGPEYARFRQHLRARTADPEVLGDIMADVNAAMRQAVEAGSGRPTRQPSPSSGGRTAREDRTSQIISLTDGDVTWAEPPSRQTRQQRRRGQRRTA